MTVVPDDVVTLGLVKQRLVDLVRQDRATKSTRFIRLAAMPDILINGRVPISIPGESTVIARPSRIEARSKDEFTWSASFEDTEGGIDLVYTEGKVTAVIRIQEREYEIQSLEGGLHLLLERDMDELAREVDVTDPHGKESPEPDGTTGSVRDGNDAHGDEPRSTDGSSDDLRKSAGSMSSSERIDVLVLYTPAAEQAVSDIANTAMLAVSQVNTAYGNSGLGSGDVSVHRNATLPLNFDESNDIFEDRDKLRTNLTA